MRKLVKKLVPRYVTDMKREVFFKLDDLKTHLNHLEKVIAKHDTRVDQLKQAIKQVEPYQPIYGLNGMIPEARRFSRDRCDAMLAALGGNMSSMRMLDIGSSLGYVSFYFADRGAKLEGWEFNEKNILVSQLAQSLNGVVNAEFHAKEFNLETVKQIKPGSFDVAVMLSVAHHIVYHTGLDNTKLLMKELTSRVPILLVELAKKGEDKDLFWDKALPDDELEIFADCKDIKIEKISDFSNHLSARKRPLYKITSQSVTVNNRAYAIKGEISFEAYKDSPARNSGSTRRYYNTKTAFIKEYILEPDVNSGHKNQIFNELSLNLKLATVYDKLQTPKLLDFEVKRDSVKLVYEKIDGQLVCEDSDLVRKTGVEKIAAETLSTLADFEKQGLYHNDVRSWNVMVDGKKSYLIDFGLAGPMPDEDNAIALLWMLHAALTGERESTDYGKTELPPLQAFTNQKKLASLYDQIRQGEKSFNTLLKNFKA